MTDEQNFKQSLAEARRMQSQGEVAEAEKRLVALAHPDSPHYQEAATALAEFYLQTGKPQEAIAALAGVADANPDQLSPVARLAYLLDVLGQTHAAVACYEQFVKRRPDSANGWFNLALARKRNLQYSEAADAYLAAIELGIENPAEAYSNLGVLYSDSHQPEKAREMYEAALKQHPKYVPVLFNLANLAEDHGDRETANTYYERVLELEPGNDEALARWSTLQDAQDDSVDQRLRDALNVTEKNASRESLSYALGNRLDRRGAYNEAFDYLQQANTLSGMRHPPYQAEMTERGIDSLISTYSRQWLEQHQLDNKATPVFICGMFRSGSTLLEQMLAAHPEITPGGELEVLPWLINRQLSPYPQRVAQVKVEEIAALAAAYTGFVNQLFPQATHVTDKRPDNFLHLGLLHAMFPDAKIIFTQRDWRDNCLSVWCQQFGGNLLYADDLDNAQHYYQQHERLMDHWHELLGDAITTVHYESLVEQPESVLRPLLESMDLQWTDAMLEFHKQPRPVRTASVWQVREPLHDRSVERWRHYESRLPATWKR